MKLRPVIFLSLAAFIALIILVWFMPLAFTACTKESWWCSFSFWITESAGKYGTVLIIVLTGIFYSVRFETWKQRAFNFFKAIAALFIFLGVFAWINEHVTKKAARIARPSHMYIFDHAQTNLKVDSLYLLEEEKRHEVLREMVNENENEFSAFDRKVIEHWIEEAGYSFPSGHSFNAFLLANIMAFSLINSRRKIARNAWALPLLWAPVVALSRVAIGAHSALDVTFGAAMGMLVATVFLYFDNTRRLIIHKKH
jgi:phosphatidylglycerophosphatase B